MKLNPYHFDVEDVVFADDSWETKLAQIRAERDDWKIRAEAAEIRLRNVEDQLKTDYNHRRCRTLDCTSTIEPYASVPLCPEHLHRAYRDQVAIWAQQNADEPDKVPADIREKLNYVRPWVVYYIQMGARVKIGRTVDLGKRMRTFSAHPDQLLAVEPGVVIDGVDRETQRHREFAEWRVKGTELFESSPALKAHIAQVVATFGDPHQYLQPHAA